MRPTPRNPLPTKPEPLEQLRARYPLALEPTYLVIDEEQALWHGIGQKPKHVFDFPDGLRFIISRERMVGTQEVVIHVSVSFDAGSKHFAEIRDGMMSLKDLHRFVRYHFFDLSADGRPLEFVLMKLPKGIPHYVIKEGTTPHGYDF